MLLIRHGTLDLRFLSTPTVIPLTIRVVDVEPGIKRKQEVRGSDDSSTRVFGDRLGSTEVGTTSSLTTIPCHSHERHDSTRRGRAACELGAQKPRTLSRPAESIASVFYSNENIQWCKAIGR